MKYVWPILLAFLIFSCSDQSAPDRRLEKFVQYRFSSDQTKDGILKFTTGELSKTVQDMSDEDVKKMIDVVGHRMKKFKIDLSKCTQTLCHLTYTLNYDVEKDGKKTLDAEVKKLAELVKENGEWRVSKIDNIKTFYNNHEAITP